MLFQLVCYKFNTELTVTDWQLRRLPTSTLYSSWCGQTGFICARRM